MANGRPGDHPYSDIVLHNKRIFGDPIDSLVREIHSMPGFKAYRPEVGEMLAKNEPPWNENPDLLFVENRLIEIKELLSKKTK